MTLQTSFDFTLPRGYVDPTGRVHRQGSMRLALAIDEIQALQDPRVQVNEAFLSVALLARVVTRLGDLPAVSMRTIEALFASDLAYLEDLYLHLNSPEALVLGATCPACGNTFPLQVTPLGAEAE